MTRIKTHPALEVHTRPTVPAKPNRAPAPDPGRLGEAAEERATQEVLRRHVKDLPIGNRARRWLLVAGIRTVGELVARTEEDLLTIRNFADTSLAKVKNYLREQGVSLQQRRERPAPEQIRVGLRDRGSGLTPREREILKLRYGLNGKVAMTLEETGRVFDLTRERVRQIQKHAEQKIMARLLFK